MTPAPKGAPRDYLPGQLAPVSGVYMATHDAHRTPHKVLPIRGEELPACRTCKVQVRFRVVEQVKHVAHDIDFSGPTSLMVVSRQS